MPPPIRRIPGFPLRREKARGECIRVFDGKSRWSCGCVVRVLLDEASFSRTAGDLRQDAFGIGAGNLTYLRLDGTL